MNILSIIEKERRMFFYHRFRNNICRTCGVGRHVGAGVWIKMREQCPLYDKSARIIQRKYNFYRLNKKIPTLWKIAEYYSAIKYHPKNIEKIIESHFRD